MLQFSAESEDDMPRMDGAMLGTSALSLLGRLVSGGLRHSGTPSPWKVLTQLFLSDPYFRSKKERPLSTASPRRQMAMVVLGVHHLLCVEDTPTRGREALPRCLCYEIILPTTSVAGFHQPYTLEHLTQCSFRRFVWFQKRVELLREFRHGTSERQSDASI